MTGRARVLFVGLDGVEKDLLRLWADAGVLPTFRRLFDTSAWGVSAGPLGIHTTALWESFSTGVSPARHARHGERQIRPGTYDTYRFLPTDLQAEPFWNVLGRAGRRSAVIDVPYVPLARDFNGVHVLDWMAHAANTGFSTWPPTLAAELRRRFGLDPIGLCDHRRLQSAADFRALRDALIARVATKTALSRHLLEREPWDLFLTVLTEGHCIGHQTWHIHDPHHLRHDPELARALGDPMQDVYRALDAAVNEHLTLAGPEATVIVLASHGMGPYYNGAHLIDAILHRLGHSPALPELPRTWAALRRGWRQLPLPARVRLVRAQKWLVDRLWPPLDSRAACFNMPNGEVWSGLRVNLAGREPYGRIRPGVEYEAFCDTLSRDLCALVNVDTNQPAVLSVRRTAQLYGGPHLIDLPDLLVEWNCVAPLTTVYSPKTGSITVPFVHQRSGHHTSEGMFFAVGPGIRPGQLPQTVSVMDFAPTIATLLDVPLPNVDGTLIAALTASSPGAWPSARQRTA